jgi:peptide/nickel transport system ATP-binding protein
VSSRNGNSAVEVEHLSLELDSGEPLIEDVSFRVRSGELLGVVGESGSGKTTVALALLGFTRPGVRLAGGAIHVGGKAVVGQAPKALRSLRGKVVAYVPQDPGGGLNPSLRVGDAILDVLRAHRPESVSDASVGAALRRVELADAFRRRYPHQLSGGEQQRVTIAMATACEPAVAVLDEPTTGLDVLTQEKILTELVRLKSEERMAMVYVSHDLAVVAKIADRILVMYAGRVLESGPLESVIAQPRHPYTKALVAAIPDVRRPRALRGIRGVAVGVGEWPKGCAFAPRCEHRLSQCEENVPELVETGAQHLARCWRWSELTSDEHTARPRNLPVAAVSTTTLLEVSGLEARYRYAHAERPAVDDVSFTIERGRCVALVGESGSGKTTIGRCIAGLHSPSSGRVVLDGEELAGRARSRTLEQRRRLQIVFQNPYESLNPRHRVRSSLERPLRLLTRLPRNETDVAVADLLERVRLPKRLADRFPAELSGGERQRVAIARALATNPDLLVCDEVTSALDVSVQAAVLELLQELRSDLHLSMLFITHNLGVVASIADSVLVMDRGVICEAGHVDAVLTTPSHEYTRRLLKAAPSLPERDLAYQ